MGILSDFFIADRATVLNYDGCGDFDPADVCQYKAITPLEAARLLALLRGETYDVAMIGEFQLLTPEDAEQWTMSVPRDMVETLAAMDESRVADVARQLADATREELNWSPDDFEPLVAELSALSRRAVQQDKSMYLWNSL